MSMRKDFNLANLLTALLIINIFQMIDMLSCGPAMFYSSGCPAINHKFPVNSSDVKILKDLGCLTYGYSTIICMVAFACFTGIDACIMAGPIVESLKPMCEAYSESILFEVSSVDSYYTNMLVHLFVTALGFSFLSFLLYLLDKAHFLNLVPKSVINGLFGAIGFGQLRIALDCVGFTGIRDTFNDSSLRSLVIIGVLAVIGYLILEIWFGDLDFLIPLYLFCLIGAFYGVASFLYGTKDILKNSREGLWLEAAESPILPSYCLNRFNFSFIKWNLLATNSFKIFSMILLFSVHIMVNLPAYRIATRIPFCFTRELRTQGLCNLITISPSYFICSYSIAAYKCGGKQWYYSVIGGLSLTGLVIFGVMIKGFIPKFALSLVPGIMFVGFSLSAFYDTLFYISTHEYIISVAVWTSIQTLSYFAPFLSDYCYPIALIFGCMLYLCIFSILNIKNKTQTSIIYLIDRIPSDTGLIVIDHMLWFYTATSLENSIKSRKEKNLILDLQRCPVIDWIAQDIIQNACSTFNQVILIGEPVGLRQKRFKSLESCFYFSTYQEYISNTCEEV